MTSFANACTQLSLDLFPAQSFESILASRQIHGMSVMTSGRLRRGWYVKTNRHRGMMSGMMSGTTRGTTRSMMSGTTHLVVPAFLENAPTDVKTALIEWALLLDRSSSKNRNGKTFELKKEHERLIFSYIESSGMTSPRISHLDPRSFVTRGRRWDLTEVFETLNRTYFNGSLASFVRWGTNRFRSYQSNKTGKNGGTFSVITIATMYNRPDTPRYAIEGIMFHEMLHIAIPPRKGVSRNTIHGTEFKNRERQFPGYAQWHAWEKSIPNRIT
jgi:hypothetical protein